MEKKPWGKGKPDFYLWLTVTGGFPNTIIWIQLFFYTLEKRRLRAVKNKRR